VRDDRGSAAVEFTLVSALLVVLVTGVLQLALALHVRNTMISCAAEGARIGATEDRSLADGEARSADMLRAALGDYSVDVSGARATVDGAPVVVMTARAPVPVLGLWGFGSMSVSVRALEEVDRG
jgi:Flp pilus assembly protein TadG